MFQETDFTQKVFSNTKEIEMFQNLSIRPTIKQCNNTIMSLFFDLCKHTNLNIKSNDPISKQNAVNNIFSKNVAFTNQLIGLVVGNFSSDEVNKYLADSKEYNKRIKQTIKERILSKI
jgi:hypothetical protein